MSEAQLESGCLYPPLSDIRAVSAHIAAAVAKEVPVNISGVPVHNLKKLPILRLLRLYRLLLVPVLSHNLYCMFAVQAYDLGVASLQPAPVDFLAHCTQFQYVPYTSPGGFPPTRAARL